MRIARGRSAVFLAVAMLALSGLRSPTQEPEVLTLLAGRTDSDLEALGLRPADAALCRNLIHGHRDDTKAGKA